ncbi:MAG TPA: hypothetical protein VGQ62_17270 [Chloroflexota bacterium]|nr:hypothetical protein [Chloroflexota bacterium]
MARQIVRGVIDRTGLRSTWPLQQVTAWRERQSWRAHPRRMASWYRDADDMHTRLFVSNLEVPEAPQLCADVAVLVRLFDSSGAQLAAQRFAIPRNASLVLELADLLPAAQRGHVPSGQVIVDFEAAQLGSSRAYLHWYNDHSLTSSHEKFGLTIPAVGGYWTVPNVQNSDEYRVHLAVTNLDDQPFTSEVTLKDDEGHALDSQIDLPPNGSRFLSLETLFANPSGFLHDQPGVLYFGNNRQPAMYYYFVHNQRLGTWRVQHL